MRKIKHSFKKHIGARKDQQDSVNITQNGKDILIALGDGMGGHTGGAMASNLFITKAQNLFENSSYDNVKEFFQQIVFEAENDIDNFAKQSGEDPHTTATLALVNDEGVHFSNIGDSRVYIFDKNGLVLRTRDHSVPEMLFQMGEITEDDMATHPDQNKLTKSLGPDSHEKLSHYSLEFEKEKDYIVLVCSDGFWEYVKEKEMVHFLLSTDIETALLNMIEIARKRGGETGDNISVAVTMLECPKVKKEKIIEPIPAVPTDKKSTEEVKPSGLSMKVIIPLVLITALGGAFGAYFYFKQNSNSENLTNIEKNIFKGTTNIVASEKEIIDSLADNDKEDISSEKDKGTQDENETEKDEALEEEESKTEEAEIDKVEEKQILGEAEMSCSKPTTYKIATGSKDGTYYKISQDLAKYVAPKSCINLEVLESEGSLANTNHLINTDGVKFAIVQNDVLESIKDKADKGDNNSKKLINKLRVLKSLYDEEIHLLTLKNSKLSSFGDIKRKTISIGLKNSGSALTFSILYPELFGENDKFAKNQNFDEGIKSLKNKEVDVVLTVGGQPLTKITNKDDIKLLSYSEVDDKINTDTNYHTTEIKEENYKWMNESVPTLSTKAFLITYNFPKGKEKHQEKIKEFLKVFNNSLEELKKSSSLDIETPHPKWKQVSNECMPKLPGGWEYYSVVAEVCKNQ